MWKRSKEKEGARRRAGIKAEDDERKRCQGDHHGRKAKEGESKQQIFASCFKGRICRAVMKRANDDASVHDQERSILPS